MTDLAKQNYCSQRRADSPDSCESTWVASYTKTKQWKWTLTGTRQPSISQVSIKNKSFYHFRFLNSKHDVSFTICIPHLVPNEICHFSVVPITHIWFVHRLPSKQTFQNVIPLFKSTNCHSNNSFGNLYAHKFHEHGLITTNVLIEHH